MFSLRRKPAPPPAPENCLPGRVDPLPTAATHFVNGRPIKPPFPANMETIILGMGCFWGAERLFWQLEGVYVTAACLHGPSHSQDQRFGASYPARRRYQEFHTT